MSDLMKNVYYNPADPGSLGGKERLKHGVLQEYGVTLKDKHLTDWLAAQDAYTLHRTAPVKYKRNRVVVVGLQMCCMFKIEGRQSIKSIEIY